MSRAKWMEQYANKASSCPKALPEMSSLQAPVTPSTHFIFMYRLENSFPIITEISALRIQLQDDVPHEVLIHFLHIINWSWCSLLLRRWWCRHDTWNFPLGVFLLEFPPEAFWYTEKHANLNYGTLHSVALVDMLLNLGSELSKCRVDVLWPVFPLSILCLIVQ